MGRKARDLRRESAKTAQLPGRRRNVMNGDAVKANLAHFALALLALAALAMTLGAGIRWSN